MILLRFKVEGIYDDFSLSFFSYSTIKTYRIGLPGEKIPRLRFRLNRKMTFCRLSTMYVWPKAFRRLFHSYFLRDFYLEFTVIIVIRVWQWSVETVLAVGFEIKLNVSKSADLQAIFYAEAQKGPRFKIYFKPCLRIIRFAWL